VTCAGWEECSPEYEIKRDGFRYNALEYIAGPMTRGFGSETRSE